jgi:hypothetical protein
MAWGKRDWLWAADLLARACLGDSLLFEIFEAVNFEGLCADVQGVARFEGVASGDGHAAVLS